MVGECGWNVGDTGAKETFSRAAVVIIDDVVVLMPFTTLRGGGEGASLGVGFIALTTSLIARAWFVYLIKFLMGSAQRGSVSMAQANGPT